MPTNTPKDKLAQQLETLLAQPLASLYEREAHLYDELAEPLSKSLVLFGAGGLGRKTLKGLRYHGIEPLAFADNNPNLQGKQINGLTVLTPVQAAQEYGQEAIFLITVYTDSAPGGIEPIIQEFKSLGCKKVFSFVPLFWKYPDQFLPHYAYDLPHKVIESASDILCAFHLFHDQTSRAEYFAQINWRLTPEYAKIPPQATHEIYFPPELIRLTEHEVFIDCGAFNGDTLQNFLEQTKGKFDKIIAFEPDPENFTKMKVFVNSLPDHIARRILTNDNAVGCRSEQLKFSAQGVASSSLSDSGDIIIQSEPLDTLIKEEIPTYIKMDIEGAELDALFGAEAHIRKHLPILAISAYHCQDHIWKLPLLINSFSKNYHFYLRRYTPRFLDDLVLYAIPDDRILT